MKPFKDSMRKMWVAYLRAALSAKVPDEPFKLPSPGREDVIGWIASSWDALSARAVVAGFRMANMIEDVGGGDGVGDLIVPTSDVGQVRAQAVVDTLVADLISTGAVSADDAVDGEDDIFDLPELTNTDECE
jgi:hypothetical protein